MKIGGERSSNVEDRRGMGVPLAAGGGIGGVIILLLYLFLGGKGAPTEVPTGNVPQSGAAGTPDAMSEFVSAVFAYNEEVWRAELPRQANVEYRYPKLVLFTQLAESACGYAQAASGPFYCPLDEKVYIDLSFYEQLKQRFGAPGDFAQAYVIAHEVGHHLQKILGIAGEVRAAQERSGGKGANDLSVRQELQADCFAGVWANHADKMKNILEPGDVDEALRAASAIGDDRIQEQTRGHVTPDSFTHGSSAQRVEWFRRGLESGQMAQCDTFK